jgi:hypothetical protein
MSKFCPNINHPDFKKLEELAPLGAYSLFNKHQGDYDAIFKELNYNHVETFVTQNSTIKKVFDSNQKYQLSQDNSSPFEKMTYEEQQSFEKTIRDLSAKISDRIGIPYEIINRKDELFKGKIEKGYAFRETQVSVDGVIFEYDKPATAIINLAYATLDTPVHEILGHPIIKAIKNNNSLYKNLLKELDPNIMDELEQLSFMSDLARNMDNRT